MALDIQEMFTTAGIITDTAAADNARGVQLSNIIKRGPAAVAALNLPSDARNIGRSLGGMLGLDTRDKNEVLAESLKGADLSTVEGINRAAGLIEKTHGGTAALGWKSQMLQRLGDNTRAQQETDSLVQGRAQQVALDTARLAHEVSLTEEGVGPNSERYPIGQTTYKNGVQIRTTDRGNRVVTTPDGREVKGTEAAAVIQEAVEEDVRIAGEVSRATTSAQVAQEEAAVAIRELRPLRLQQANIEQAIIALRNGAPTGPLQSLFPAITSAQLLLKNAQEKLGIDIVGSTTFGSLSAGELDLALNIGLDASLDEEDLARDLIARYDATQKLMEEFSSLAIEVANGGDMNTWTIKREKELKAARDAAEAADTVSARQAAEQAERDKLRAALGLSTESSQGRASANQGSPTRRNR
jgi:hypothetical protein